MAYVKEIMTTETCQLVSTGPMEIAEFEMKNPWYAFIWFKIEILCSTENFS